MGRNDPRPYTPPPAVACEVLDPYPVALDTRLCDRYVCVQWIYRGKVVFFSVQQEHRIDAGSQWFPVTRIDTKHGEVHRHHFGASGAELDRVTLEVIPDRGWDCVDKWLIRALDDIEDHYIERVRRWRDG